MTGTTEKITTPTRDPEKTRARLLKKATTLFSQKGYQGASVDSIVEAAKVNKRMAYHYFENKDGLYREVFLYQWRELKKWFDQALEEDSAEKSLLTVLELYSDFLASHQEFVRLMMWEALEGGAISRSIWKDIRGPVFYQIEELIVRAQKQKKIDSKIDPGHFIISFLGTVNFYFAYAPTITDILRKDPLSSAALAERKVQLKLFLGKFFT